MPAPLNLQVLGEPRHSRSKRILIRECGSAASRCWTTYRNCRPPHEASCIAQVRQQSVSRKRGPNVQRGNMWQRLTASNEVKKQTTRCRPADGTKGHKKR